MKTAKVEVYKDKSGERRWRLKAANGRIIADSAEGYTRKRDAVRAADRFVETTTWCLLETVVLEK